jgi:S1-C subfamily serine protease
VVYITTVALRRDLFTLNVYEIPRGAGSGFVWDDQGHVVTNFHVIRGRQPRQVTLADQRSGRPRAGRARPEKDLAVLASTRRGAAAAAAARAPPGPRGRPEGARHRQPLRLDQTLTTGVISALGREIESLARVPIRDVIQTDAAINPGNSGGPLLDSAGRLIGVNTAIYSPSGAYAGIGFAVPVDTVNWATRARAGESLTGPHDAEQLASLPEAEPL